MENPYVRKDINQLEKVQVEHARRSDLVWKNTINRIDRIERAIVELGERQGRGAKLYGAVAEIAGDLKN